jgi:hypothetical protein
MIDEKFDTFASPGRRGWLDADFKGAHVAPPGASHPSALIAAMRPPA